MGRKESKQTNKINIYAPKICTDYHDDRPCIFFFIFFIYLNHVFAEFHINMTLKRLLGNTLLKTLNCISGLRINIILKVFKRKFWGPTG